jgi:hypothetical protein
MKVPKAIRSLTSVIIGLFALSAFAHEAGGPLTAEQKNYLALYEPIRAALAADNLGSAKKAAEKLAAAPQEKAANEAEQKRLATNLAASKKLAGSGSISDARDAFKILSRKANHLAEGQKGYYRYICPHVANDEGKWVQTTQDISNPYEGKANPKCGKALTD